MKCASARGNRCPALEVLWGYSRYLINVVNNSRAGARWDSSDRRTIIIIRPGRKQHRATLYYRSRDISQVFLARDRDRGKFSLLLPFSPRFTLLSRTGGKKRPSDERRYVALICHGSGRLRNRERWPRNRFRGCPGFHNANYDRFALPLRKCSSQRCRVGYRFLRTPKLQLCPARVFHKARTWRRARRIIYEELHKSCNFVNKLSKFFEAYFFSHPRYNLIIMQNVCLRRSIVFGRKIFTPSVLFCGYHCIYKPVNGRKF